MSAYSVIVQEKDFNLDNVYSQLRENTSSTGAVVILEKRKDSKLTLGGRKGK